LRLNGLSAPKKEKADGNSRPASLFLQMLQNNCVRLERGNAKDIF
jgi:hypothetical protein